MYFEFEKFHNDIDDLPRANDASDSDQSLRPFATTLPRGIYMGGRKEYETYRQPIDLG
jgi:hypothetical protein